MRSAAVTLEKPVAFAERYTLLRKLATGGMAEIFLARQAAMAGFEKLVVIKRLRDELAHDPRVVDMFLDEARIGALLNHPNIVHVYDVGEADGLPYIAMEYIVGEELNVLCRRGLALHNFLPLAHAVELIRQAAAGLGYFHAKRAGLGPGGMLALTSGGETTTRGEPLAIVHCDISPTNLLVTEDGFMKVIDFGIAQAKGQRYRSDSVMPGKLSYMSPEQAARQVIDHRSDIFSLGIVLYEITVGKRLFRGHAADVVARLAAGKIEPPTFVKPSFPPDLEAIVLRALEPHRDNRYQTAYELADDLETFLREGRHEHGPVPLARYLDELAQAGGRGRRPELARADSRGDVDEPLDFDTPSEATRLPKRRRTPTPVPEWEDQDERDAEVAAALGMEIDELYALRTPVPRDLAKPSVAPSASSPAPSDTALPATPARASEGPDAERGAGAKARPPWLVTILLMGVAALLGALLGGLW